MKFSYLILLLKSISYRIEKKDNTTIYTKEVLVSKCERRYFVKKPNKGTFTLVVYNLDC